MATVKRKSLLILISCVAVVAIGTAALSLTRKPSVQYRVTFLPTLGGFKTDPHCINDRGQVVGISETATGSVYLFVWDKEQGFRPVERFDDPPHTGALAINNLGQISGTMADPNGNHHGFLLDPNGSRQTLGTLGGKQSTADGLNNKGQVIGSAEVPDRNRHAFVWDAAHGMQDLGTLGGLNSSASSINDAGQIVGFAEMPDRKAHMVIWDPDTADTGHKTQDDAGPNPQTMASSPPSGNAAGRQPPGYRITDLGYAGTGPLTCEINNNGLVVRRFGTTSGKTYFMAWTKATGEQKLNFVIDSAWPCGLNEKNQFLIRARPTGMNVFGRIFHRRHQCYLWDLNSTPMLLESHLSVKDLVYFAVREFNNNGQIVAMIRTKDSAQIRAALIEKEEGKKAGK
jgi:probable HAF family extracellular repeat protein